MSFASDGWTLKTSPLQFSLNNSLLANLLKRTEATFTADKRLYIKLRWSKALRTNAGFTSGGRITVLMQGSKEKPVSCGAVRASKTQTSKTKSHPVRNPITFLDLKSSNMLNSPFPLEIWLLTLVGNLSTRRLFTAGRWRTRPLLAVECQKWAPARAVCISQPWMITD